MIEPDDLPAEAHEFCLKASVIGYQHGGPIKHIHDIGCGLYPSLSHLGKLPEFPKSGVPRMMVTQHGPSLVTPYTNGLDDRFPIVSKGALCLRNAREEGIPVEGDGYCVLVTFFTISPVPRIKTWAPYGEGGLTLVSIAPAISDISVWAEESSSVLMAVAPAVMCIRTFTDVVVTLTCPVLDIDELVVGATFDVGVSCNKNGPVIVSSTLIPPVGPSVFRRKILPDR